MKRCVRRLVREVLADALGRLSLDLVGIIADYTSTPAEVEDPLAIELPLHMWHVDQTHADNLMRTLNSQCMLYSSHFYSDSVPAAVVRLRKADAELMSDLINSVAFLDLSTGRVDDEERQFFQVCCVCNSIIVCCDAALLLSCDVLFVTEPAGVSGVCYSV